MSVRQVEGERAVAHLRKQLVAFLAVAVLAAGIAAGCGRGSPTEPTWLEARISFWRDYQRGPEKIDIYLDEWFVGTLHLSRRTPPDFQCGDDLDCLR